MDSATWAALALTLTLIGAALSFVAWRRRGLAAGLRGLSWTLLPVAAWLTGTLRLAVDVGQAVTDWAARLVFSPTVWLGLAVGGCGGRTVVPVGRDAQPRARESTLRAVTRSLPRPDASSCRRAGRAATRDDLDDMADIEAILKKHGI